MCVIIKTCPGFTQEPRMVKSRLVSFGDPPSTDEGVLICKSPTPAVTVSAIKESDVSLTLTRYDECREFLKVNSWFTLI